MWYSIGKPTLMAMIMLFSNFFISSVSRHNLVWGNCKRIRLENWFRFSRWRFNNRCFNTVMLCSSFALESLFIQYGLPHVKFLENHINTLQVAQWVFRLFLNITFVSTSEYQQVSLKVLSSVSTSNKFYQFIESLIKKAWITVIWIYVRIKF